MGAQDSTIKRRVVKELQFCRHCNEEVFSGKGFCPHCGGAIEAISGITKVKFAVCPGCNTHELYEGEQVCEFCEKKDTLDIALFVKKTTKLEQEEPVLHNSNLRKWRVTKLVSKGQKWRLSLVLMFFFVVSSCFSFLVYQGYTKGFFFPKKQDHVVVVKTPTADPIKTPEQNSQDATQNQTIPIRTAQECDPNPGNFPQDTLGFPLVKDGCVAIFASQNGYVEVVKGTTVDSRKSWQAPTVFALGAGRYRQWSLGTGKALPLTIVPVAAGQETFCTQYNSLIDKFYQQTGIRAYVVQEPYEGWHTCN